MVDVCSPVILPKAETLKGVWDVCVVGGAMLDQGLP